ncbi:MAG: trypsin-like peptidase domain-containing protein [Chlamydiia bacterium]|nr:trypsin-like peptidase domain-containing protein [Chlamydiia bacterium]
MRLLVIFLFLFSSSLLALDGMKNSVVQIATTHKEYDYESPWAPPTTERTGGSGFIIEGNRIVTNAHVVKDASFIEVRSASSREWHEAHVKVVGHDCDLAILELDDPSFFQGKTPLAFGESLLHQQEEVAVHGFPMGGRELSVTKGIVSRVELGNYAHSGAHLLVSQIDAPINPGNSGGPVLSEGKVVGVVHQVFFIGQNIGYMIPIPVIKHFMEEVEKEEYLGFPDNAFKVQPIRNPAMRAYYGIEEKGGLLIVDVPDNHFLSEALKPGDILLTLDGHEIDAYGWVELEEMGISLPFQYLVMMKHFGDMIEIEILREGERVQVTSCIDPSRKGRPLVKQEFDKAPTYFVMGGLVFQPLVQNYLRHLDVDQSLGFIDLFYDWFRGRVEKDRDEVVVLSRILDDIVNVGYQHLEKKIVDSVNGQKVRNLQHLIEIFEALEDEYFVIVTRDGVEIILDRKEVMERNPKILNRYFINHDRSRELR